MVIVHKIMFIAFFFLHEIGTTHEKHNSLIIVCGLPWVTVFIWEGKCIIMLKKIKIIEPAVSKKWSKCKVPEICIISAGQQGAIPLSSGIEVF